VPSYVSGTSQTGNPSQPRLADTDFERSVALNSNPPTTSPSTDATAKRASFKEAIHRKAIEGKGKPKHVAFRFTPFVATSIYDHHIDRFVAA